MTENNEDDKALSFVKRWIQAFRRIIKTFGKKEIVDNSEFVDKILENETANATTQEEIDIINEKRQLLAELCDDVDAYYEKKAAADKTSNLEDWFKEEVRTFVHATIPDATQEDVKEAEEMLSKSMDDDISVRASLLESEFSSENPEVSVTQPTKAKGNE